ncbi:inorganic pyrophosphatase [Rhodococcus sp. 27YEA15]|uniref:inorganic pyrophosphatase n=1 Tax=Rhodococcus sp. 27YEA15 TaxID=3156259 RepID=UPI003C7C8F01
MNTGSGDGFFATLDHLTATSGLVIDRPRGFPHPRYPHIVYPLDYGYLEGTAGGDGAGIDVFGSADGTGVVAAAVIADAVKRDVEIKIVLDCTAADVEVVAEFLRSTLGLGTAILRRESSPQR